MEEQNRYEDEEISKSQAEINEKLYRFKAEIKEEFAQFRAQIRAQHNEAMADIRSKLNRIMDLLSDRIGAPLDHLNADPEESTLVSMAENSKPMAMQNWIGHNSREHVDDRILVANDMPDSKGIINCESTIKHSIDKENEQDEENDDNGCGMLSIVYVQSILGSVCESSKIGSTNGSHKACVKGVIPSLEVVWDQNLWWNDTHKVFDEMTPKFRATVMNEQALFEVANYELLMKMVSFDPGGFSLLQKGCDLFEFNREGDYCLTTIRVDLSVKAVTHIIRIMIASVCGVGVRFDREFSTYSESSCWFHCPTRNHFCIHGNRFCLLFEEMAFIVFHGCFLLVPLLVGSYCWFRWGLILRGIRVCAIFVYILGDKDVFERVEKWIIPMVSTWVKMENHEFDVELWAGVMILLMGSTIICFCLRKLFIKADLKFFGAVNIKRSPAAKEKIFSGNLHMISHFDFQTSKKATNNFNGNHFTKLLLPKSVGNDEGIGQNEGNHGNEIDGECAQVIKTYISNALLTYIYFQNNQTWIITKYGIISANLHSSRENLTYPAFVEFKHASFSTDVDAQFYFDPGGIYVTCFSRGALHPLISKAPGICVDGMKKIVPPLRHALSVMASGDKNCLVGSNYSYLFSNGVHTILVVRVDSGTHEDDFTIVDSKAMLEGVNFKLTTECILAYLAHSELVLSYPIEGLFIDKKVICILTAYITGSLKNEYFDIFSRASKEMVPFLRMLFSTHWVKFAQLPSWSSESSKLMAWSSVISFIHNSIKIRMKQIGYYVSDCLVSNWHNLLHSLESFCDAKSLVHDTVAIPYSMHLWGLVLRSFYVVLDGHGVSNTYEKNNVASMYPDDAILQKGSISDEVPFEGKKCPYLRTALQVDQALENQFNVDAFREATTLMMGRYHLAAQFNISIQLKESMHVGRGGYSIYKEAVVASSKEKAEVGIKIFVWDPGVSHFTTLRTRRLLRGRICHVPRFRKIRRKAEDALVTVGYELLAVSDVI